MSDIAIYEAGDGQVEVRLDRETVWLSPAQMSQLFGRDRTVVGRHIAAVFAEGELDRESNVQKMHIPSSDKPVSFYNLDVIISVGYRVKSAEGVRFRQWATRTLKDHLTRGYTLNRHRLETNARALESALELVRRTAASGALTADQGLGLLDVITRYTRSFLLLQRYDDRQLDDPLGTPGGELPEPDEARAQITGLKADLLRRGEASALFGNERDDQLASILGNLAQSVLGEPAYPSVESKAAHLLYFLIKDHPFSDGNKRIGSLLFILFLHRNNALLGSNGEPRINDIGLTALALLVAESAPRDKDVVIRLVMNLLAPGAGTTHINYLSAARTVPAPMG